MIRPSNRASIRNISDYSPFGVQLSERTISDGYRFGFNSMEKDDEIKGTGNSYTTQFRQNDPRIGRWLSIDPKPEAGMSPYSSMDNNPIRYNDVLGLYTEKRAERMAKRGAKNGFFTRVTHNKDAGKRDYGVYYNKRNESNSGNYSATQYDGKFKEIGSKGLVMDSEFQTSLIDDLGKPIKLPELNSEDNIGLAVGNLIWQGAAESAADTRFKLKEKGVPKNAHIKPAKIISKTVSKVATAITIYDKTSKIVNGIIEKDVDKVAGNTVALTGYTVAGVMMAAPTGVTQVAGALLFLGVSIYDLLEND